MPEEAQHDQLHRRAARARRACKRRHSMTDSAPTVVQRLAAIADDVRRDGLPGDLRQDVARRVLDLIGNSLSATGLPPARAVTAYVQAAGGTPEAVAIGTGLRVPAANAALVNGTL